jgi:hypothetical protein
VELVARNAAGTARRSVGVLVLRPPEIRQFTVTPPTTDAGQLVTLAWEAVRAESVRVFGPDLEPTGVVVDPLLGSLQVRPMQTATYTLRAENALGRVEEALPVSVGSVSTPAAPAPTPTTLPR